MWFVERGMGACLHAVAFLERCDVCAGDPFPPASWQFVCARELASFDQPIYERPGAAQLPRGLLRREVTHEESYRRGRPGPAPSCWWVGWHLTRASQRSDQAQAARRSPALSGDRPAFLPFVRSRAPLIRAALGHASQRHDRSGRGAGAGTEAAGALRRCRCGCRVPWRKRMRLRPTYSC